MLAKTIGLTIKNYKIAMTSPLKFFEDDDLELYFKVEELGVDVIDDESDGITNPIFPESAILFIETSNKIDSIESVSIDGNEICFRLTNKYTNRQNIGVGRMQIVLFDGVSRKALPPFEFEIQRIIYDHDPIVYNGLTSEGGIALLSEDNMLLESTDEVYGIKISELPYTEEIIGFIPIVQHGETRQINIDTILDDVNEKINTILDEEIPSLEGYATEEYVKSSIAQAKLEGEEVDLTGYTTQSQFKEGLATKADEGHIHSYTELTDVPTIPSLEGYATEEYVMNEIDAEVIFDFDMNTISSLGGISAGENLNGLTIKEIISKLLFPYVAPTVSASLVYTPSSTIFELGQTVKITNITGRVVKKSEVITQVQFWDGNTLLQTITDEVGGSASYSYLFSTPILITGNLSNSRFRFSATDATGKTYYANTIGLTFYYPYYMGIVAEGDVLDSKTITALSKKIQGKATTTNSYTTNNERMVFAYPKSYGILSKILDANSFDVTGTFSLNEVLVVGLDGTTQPYYVYVNNASTVSNFKMTFYY